MGLTIRNGLSSPSSFLCMFPLLLKDPMPGHFEFKLLRYCRTAKKYVGTESKTAFIKLKSLNWLSKFINLDQK